MHWDIVLLQKCDEAAFGSIACSLIEGIVIHFNSGIAVIKDRLGDQGYYLWVQVAVHKCVPLGIHDKARLSIYCVHAHIVLS